MGKGDLVKATSDESIGIIIEEEVEFCLDYAAAGDPIPFDFAILWSDGAIEGADRQFLERL